MHGCERDDAGLVADIKGERRRPVGKPEDGLGVRVADGRGLGPGHAAIPADGVSLEQVGSETELGVADVVVFEDRRALGVAEEGEGAGGLDWIEVRFARRSRPSPQTLGLPLEESSKMFQRLTTDSSCLVSDASGQSGRVSKTHWMRAAAARLVADISVAGFDVRVRTCWSGTTDPGLWGDGAALPFQKSCDPGLMVEGE